MILIRSLGYQPKKLALDHYSRQNVRANLFELGIKPTLFTGVYRLRGLEKTQYDAFLALLRLWKIGPEDCRLILPPLSDLRNVDFVTILGQQEPKKIIAAVTRKKENEIGEKELHIFEEKKPEIEEILKTAKEEIFTRCVRPKGYEAKIILTDLPSIYRTFIIGELHNTLFIEE